MALNGLDNVEVTQAYQGALAEAGGWFLLRYTSRDAIQVLTRGTGGATEARAVVAAYEDKSPLYGLLLYRRRKVLLKYVPPETSRLLQARVAVHFITLTEKFAPCDVVLSITSPDELSDSALASACTLHTAAPSSSSSSGSSRAQKLSWIQEAAEEGSQINGEDNGPSRPLSMANIPTIHEPTMSDDIEPVPKLPTIQIKALEPEPKPVESKPTPVKPTPEISHVTIEKVTETPTPPETDLLEFSDTLKNYDKLFETGPEPRLSSQSQRPNYDELYEHYYAQYTKPKVKLGPRPTAAVDNKRPKTSGSSSQDAAKPKSSLPPGLRSSVREKRPQREMRSASTTSVNTSIAIPPPPPIPSIPSALDLLSSPISPYTSRSPASVRSMPVSVYSSRLRATGMTQEKTRLMKALEMRKKQQQAQADRLAKEAEEAAAKEKLEAEESSPKAEENATTDEVNVPENVSANVPANVPVAAPNSTEDVLSKAPEKADVNDDNESTFVGSLQTSHLESSGLVFTGSLLESDDLNSTISVSSPISAQTHGSSAAPSTRPSSISDDEQPSVEGIQKPSTILEPSQTSPVDSTPTIVSEDRTLTYPEDTQTQTPPSDTQTQALGNVQTKPVEQSAVLDETEELDAPASIQTEEPLGLIIPEDKQDLRSRRRSKRESLLRLSSADDSQPEETDSRPAQPTNKRQSWYESKDKRRGMLDQLEISGDNSEAEYLSDDSFMEELQSATVQEALVISKSPISPYFQRSSASDLSIPTRSASQPFQELGRSPVDQLGRKPSGNWPPRSNTDSVVTAKKINVSSGISQRIKALAEKTQRESAPSINALDSPGSTLAERKSSFFAASPNDMSPIDRPRSRLGTPTFLGASPTATPDKKPQPVKPSVYTIQRGTETAESVQVTARIVRDERTKQLPTAIPIEKTPLDLHASPLVIDHQKSSMWSPRSPTRTRAEPKSPTAMSSHSVEQNNSRASSENSWRAFGRRLSEPKSGNGLEGEEKRDDKKDKKESRTSKMFKRMSSSIPWKSGANPGEHDRRSTSLATLQGPPPPVQIGDLNVQFPDTLLWKRRWVEIDTGGNLVLSPSKSNEKGVIKRYHLSEFRAPYPPDQDRQELPNSVVLDFVDGRTLQCACETYMAQVQVLQILREAHDAWRAYNQTQ